ncbi:hypothetical protein EVAR_9384_1 [Eumeta japonica]|uniref:Abscission/NoCut checkpoint regulator n=1 Tax=Eumeta variegata TaxID=151549 RepID=A0A4C1UEA8_EUMVA|nr:hypothetical protein EVAR_9384_1 [Eumeta japonica]
MRKENGSGDPIAPPDAYYKRLENIVNCNEKIDQSNTNDPNQDIVERLQKLKKSTHSQPSTSNQEIEERLKKLKTQVNNASEEELQERLAKLKGVPVTTGERKIALPLPDLRTEQEQANDLMKQYLEQFKMDENYKNEFDSEIDLIEARLQKLKGSSSTATTLNQPKVESDSSDDESTVKKVIAKYTAQISLEEDKDSDELPFCEICNNDAKMRCLGCRYLFCKRCFLEHKDEDDGCDQYEPFEPKKSNY